MKIVKFNNIKKRIHLGKKIVNVNNMLRKVKQILEVYFKTLCEKNDIYNEILSKL